MKTTAGRSDDIVIAYLGGGSTQWAWTLMVDLALEPALSGTIRLHDLDVAAAERNRVIGERLSRRADVAARWRYEVSPRLEDALEGADFVFVSIEPSAPEQRISDMHDPDPFGILQSVADTTGPGGLFRAVRAIPLMVGFAQAVARHCPDAWVVNYTNPMALCTAALHRGFPGIRAFGCCHEVFSTQYLMARMLHLLKGIPEFPRDEVEVNVLGINHFTWLDRASWRGMDLLPLYRGFAQARYEEGYDWGVPDYWQGSPKRFAERVKFDLFLAYGAVAAAGDRHLVEFMPGQRYLRDEETIRHWRFHRTPAAFFLEKKRLAAERAVRLASGSEDFVLAPSGEDGVRQIKALAGVAAHRTNVNLPNAGQMDGMPRGAIVETNAVFTGGEVRPVLAGRLPPAVEALVLPHAARQAPLLDAVLDRDRRRLFGLFLDDPLVTCGQADARRLFDLMAAKNGMDGNGWT